MTAATQPPTPGHAFLSYVREDSASVDRLQAALQATGIQVWRDKNDLWPGQDWRLQIKKAINTGSLAFIACFSPASEARETSYQSEELILAVEQIRLRRPGQQWLFPVRFGEVELPPYDLGAGRDLGHLQRSDLFGGAHETNMFRLVASVMKLLEVSGAPQRQGEAYIEDPVAFMKATLHDQAKQIQLEDFVNAKAKAAVDELNNAERFPVTIPHQTAGTDAYRFIAKQATHYWAAVKPLAEVLAAGCRWGTPAHNALWSRAVRAVANRPKELGGTAALVKLQEFPTLALVYTAALSAIDRDRYDALKAVAIDPTVRARLERSPVALINTIHPWKLIEDKVVASILVRSLSDEVTDETIEALRTGREGSHHTGVSDYLFGITRPIFSDLTDDDFDDLFDKTETLLGLLATDDKLDVESREERSYRYGAWFGRSSWKDRYSYAGHTPESAISSQLASAGSAWPPLQSGLFGGSQERAQNALTSYTERMTQIRSHRW